MWLEPLSDIQSPQHEVYGSQRLLRIELQLTSSGAGIWVIFRKFIPIKQISTLTLTKT